ncbi:MAG: hypothetical protein ACLRVN_05580 [Butyricicoccus sp.]
MLAITSLLRVDDALYLILRQAAAVLEGDGQWNVVDAVDQNRNLDLSVWLVI